jgi:predicted dehydrogenase
MKEMRMERVRLGILSHAHGHANVYCRVMQNFPDVELVATWDDNLERGQQAAQNFGMEFRPEADQVLNDPDIDAVIVTMETNRHADFVEKAAAAGKAILCQKPLATTLADCDRIIRAVKQHGVKFSMAFQMRQDPVNQKIKSLLDEGAVGKVAIVRRRHTIGVLLDPNFVNGPTHWHFDPEANIGMFFDDATHAADWFYWLLGEPTSVTAEIDNFVTNVSPDDNGVALYRFPNGPLGILLNSSTTIAGVNTTEIYGDEGTIIQDYGDGPSTAPGSNLMLGVVPCIEKSAILGPGEPLSMAQPSALPSAYPPPLRSISYIRSFSSTSVHVLSQCIRGGPLQSS